MAPLESGVSFGLPLMSLMPKFPVVAILLYDIRVFILDPKVLHTLLFSKIPLRPFCTSPMPHLYFHHTAYFVLSLFPRDKIESGLVRC